MSRRKKIINQYTVETQDFLFQNQEEIKRLFLETFEVCNIGRPLDKYGVATDYLCKQAKENLQKLNHNNLKDSSSVLYMRAIDDQVDMIEASGTYRGPRSIKDTYILTYKTETKEELRKFIADKEYDLNRWNDFVSYIGGKEVIVPIYFDDNFNTKGYIFRGVIEK